MTDYGAWCLTSDIDGSRLAAVTDLDGAKADYLRYLAEHPESEGDLFIENIVTGEQLYWNRYTRQWDTL
jgi:hypothetical protein